MSDTVTVQQLKHAFVIQLSPQASQIERTNSFNLIQSFKSTPTRDQVKVIFELITDSDSVVKHAAMGLLHDFVRLQWQNLGTEETGIIKSTILNHLISNPDSRQVPRISAEIAIREWPQQWPELTNILTSESENHAIPLIRLFGDIQFHINNQNIPNLQRQKDLSKALCEIHDRLIKLILSVCMSNSISMDLKNEALTHSLALIESSTHPILIQLLDADHLWSLLQQTVNLIGRPEASICVTLFELFIICISRQYEKSDERIEIWKLFAKNNRFGIIDAVLKAAIPHFGNSAVEFHLICRVSQFVENLGNCLQACWFSPKNCNRDAIKSLKNCQTEIEWLLELLRIKNIPFLTHSVIVAFNLISKSIDFDDEHDLASELEMIARPIAQSLLETLESFEQLKIQTVPQLHQAFETQFEFCSFKTKTLNQAGHLVKNLTKIIPSCMSGIFADLTESAIAHPDIFPAKITISFLTSSIPILAMKLKSSSELNPKLILSFTNLLNHATLSQKQLKVKLELVRCHLEILKLLDTELVHKTVNCLITMCESIDGIDPQSSKLRRNSASALVNLTNTAPETMEPFFDMIHSTACKWTSSRPHAGARVLLFEVLVMLCWLPKRQMFLPQLLTELLTVATSLLSQTQPKLEDIKTAEEFGKMIGFDCESIDDLLVEQTFHYQNRSSITNGVNLLLVILRRCADGSGNSSDENLRNALAKGVAGMIKVMDLFYFFQQLYLQMPNKLCKEILDTDAADMLQINEIEADQKEESGLTRVRSLIENMQLQIQLALKSGAKVWPDMYQMPNLIEKLSLKTMDKLPPSRQRLILRQLLGPMVQYCPADNVQLAAQILHDVIITQTKQLNQNWAKIEEADYESEKEELLHYYRTQTLTKDYSDFLSTGIILTKSKSVSPAVLFLLEKRPEVILDGICSPLQWQCTKTMQKMCSLIPVIVEQYSKVPSFNREKCRDCFVSILKGFTIHGEHPENISPLVQAAFSIYKNHFGDLAQILVQIPNVDQAAIDQLNKGLQDAKIGEKKQRSRLKDICNPLLKKPVSEEGKLEMKIVSLPPLFGSKRQRMKNFESFGNENFDVNWIGLENY